MSDVRRGTANESRRLSFEEAATNARNTARSFVDPFDVAQRELRISGGAKYKGPSDEAISAAAEKWKSNNVESLGLTPLP